MGTTCTGDNASVRRSTPFCRHSNNLHGLNALLPSYAGKVKRIYIVPPYNTGNAGWVYNDNVNSPLMRQWLGKPVQ